MPDQAERLTDAELSELERLEREATEGPWLDLELIDEQLVLALRKSASKLLSAARREREQAVQLEKARLETLDEVYQRAGQIVPDRGIDMTGQHYGIASVREIICELMAPLVKS